MEDIRDVEDGNWEKLVIIGFATERVIFRREPPIATSVSKLGSTAKEGN